MNVTLRYAMSCFLIIVGSAEIHACSTERPQVRVGRSVFLMGTVARFISETEDRETALEQLERMVQVVEDVEAEISTWRDDSYYSRINRQPVGEALTVPPRPCTILRRAGHWWQKTGGAFDPGVGSLVEAWGLRGTGRWPTPANILSARQRAGFGWIEIVPKECAITRRLPVVLDAGAFGKGAALDAVRRAMGQQAGRWFVNFGGQMAVSGIDWPVALSHPERRDEVVVELMLAGGSLATSGGAERDLTTPGGHSIGHILDPRTGIPVERRGSVSVWHTSALGADALSTALQVLGPKTGFQWAVEHDVAACFLVINEADSITVQMTPRFARLDPLLVAVNDH